MILIGALTFTACGGDDDDATSASENAAEATAEDSSGFDMAAGDEFLATDASGEAAAVDRPAQSDADFDIGVVGRDVIVEMRVVMSSDDIQRSVASIMAAASTLGGGVASSDVNYGNDDVNEGFAVLVVKVPPESVDRLLSGLGDTGTVQSINQSARDVTDQIVDLDVRIDNARQSVANVREFMERTENLNELVTLEAELTRRQTELEQLEAQQRNLADRVALSTITVEIVPTDSVPEPVDEGGDGILDALRSGWDAFTALLFGIGFVLAATLPFVISGLLLALVAWIVVRRRGARGADPTATTRTPDQSDTDDGAGTSERETEPVG